MAMERRMMMVRMTNVERNAVKVARRQGIGLGCGFVSNAMAPFIAVTAYLGQPNPMRYEVANGGGSHGQHSEPPPSSLNHMFLRQRYSKTAPPTWDMSPLALLNMPCGTQHT